MSVEGCPLSAPFKCSDGTCKKLPVSTSDSLGCTPKVVCPTFRPYLCANGECVGDPSVCKAFSPCQSEEFICEDGSCSQGR